MNARAIKSQEDKSQSAVNAIPKKQNNNGAPLQFVDNRGIAVTQRKLQEVAGNSRKARKAIQLQAVADKYTAHSKQLKTSQNVSNSQLGKPVIQRIVEEVKSGGNTYYRSSFDVKRYFATLAEAQTYEDGLIANMSFPSYKNRAPTAFTFAQTSSDNSIGSGSSKQGPHVYAEVGMNKAFGDMGRPQLAAAAARLPDPDETRDRFDGEMADMSDDEERGKRVDRFYVSYRQLHGLAQSIDPESHKGGKKTKATNARRNVVKMAANMGAYGTYGYQERNPHEHEDWDAMIGGKGEKANAPVKKLYDDHAEDFVVDDGAFKDESEMRRAFLDERKEK